MSIIFHISYQQSALQRQFEIVLAVRYSASLVNKTNKQKNVEHNGMECLAFDPVIRSSGMAFSP